ncbi:MAG: hypothetical protein MI861_26375 [Pirellulales bacterium]|nr:hypothetical protein [Pirellulales bacterium]
MARVGIVFGLLLCGLTVTGMIGSPTKHPTFFVPMMVGIPILFCGVVALNPHRRSHAMQVAAVIALLGFCLSTGRAVVLLARWGREREINLFMLELILAMSVICLIFLVISCLHTVSRAKKRLGPDTPVKRVKSSPNPSSRSELQASTAGQDG